MFWFRKCELRVCNMFYGGVYFYKKDWADWRIHRVGLPSSKIKPYFFGDLVVLLLTVAMHTGVASTMRCAHYVVVFPSLKKKNGCVFSVFFSFFCSFVLKKNTMMNINGRMKASAQTACDDQVRAFNECCKGRIVSMVWACRDIHANLDACIREQ